ncbi:MFS transporter [Streptomyces lonarensis]|uniref:MFS transporter n=1 Tax=Streptomyces lonarensis TaxID=700599 RepID=A0A7X6HY90_9ACTN|nr:MFS transporter [Streptomyces lonarensis]NJQ05371.1 MFS transporter [Streptomyces lonarensis]
MAEQRVTRRQRTRPSHSRTSPRIRHLTTPGTRPGSPTATRLRTAVRRRPARPEQLDRRTVRTAALLVVVLTAGAYLPSPLYPRYQQLFGFDDLGMTMIFAMFALVSGPALLLGGPAADRVGHQPVLRLSLLLAAAGSCCFALADATPWLFAGRVAQALALGAATGAAQALITTHRHPAARIGGPLFASLAFTVGTAAGPALAGLLAEHAPGPLLTPFLLHLLLLGWVWCRLRTTVPVALAPGRTRARWRPTRPRIPADLRPLFLVAGLNGFLAWAVLGIYLALVPALLVRALGTDDAALTGAVLAAVLICSLVAQLAATRRGTTGAQQLGVALLGGSLLLLALSGASSLALTLAAAVPAGVGHGLAFSGAARAVDARTPDGQRAGIGAALHLLFYLGSGAPAVVVGILTIWVPLATAVTWISWGAVGPAALLVLATGRLARPSRNCRVPTPG